ncbi:MAG: hypothetical protein HRT95_00945 [Moritella sp.]|uniref:hypothetical protein n=1 Tax=Moritella sp. TaxID=78556 RepID=UPI001DDEE952|nr:hypothetical protein [Moritella sp.]NQZ48782.1 hypothetical protein [Moritella sp.]
MRITKPTNNANISLLLIVVFLIACMVNNAYAFNQPIFSGEPLSATTTVELYNASYADSSDGVCKLTEKLLQKASTHMDELVMVILMIILFSHYFTRQTLNVTYLSNTFAPSQRRHLILCKFDE